MSSTASLTRPATLHAAFDVIDDLQHRNEELEALVGLRWLPPACLDLTRTETKLLGAILAARPTLTVDAAYVVIYSGRRNPPEPNTIRVVAHRLRRKLAVHGITLGSRWGAGYSLDADARQRLEGLYGPGEKP